MGWRGWGGRWVGPGGRVVCVAGAVGIFVGWGFPRGGFSFDHVLCVALRENCIRRSGRWGWAAWPRGGAAGRIGRGLLGFCGFLLGAAGRWGRLARGVGREVYFMKVVHCALVAQCSPVSLGLKLVLNNVGCLVTFASSGAWRKPFFRKKKV